MEHSDWLQVVSRGSDQVSITSKFEAREDAGELLSAMVTMFIVNTLSCDT